MTQPIQSGVDAARSSARAPTTRNFGNVPAWKAPPLGLAILLSIVAACVPTICSSAAPPPPDARSLVARSLEAGFANEDRLHGWISESRVLERQIETDGTVKSEETKTFDQVPVDGVYLRKLIEKNGKPLNAEEAKKEDARIRKLASSRRNETEAQRDRRLKEASAKRQKSRDFNREILDAFDFKTLGEESVNGRPSWLLGATPRPGYHPREMRAQIFPHMRGKIWIDRQDLLWSKAEADAFEPISIGLSLVAKLEQGAHFSFEQVRMEDATWLLKQVSITAVARVALVKRIGIDQQTTFDRFRKLPAGAAADDTPAK